eukprot:TRINITY_DN2152_c0_g1_i2.p1 TRINITY_DN2152_c0_g1~~TRINITY_DN2152_c0_g1_i2.p1  ORF type:complete len:504 (-),score=73.81 TRINITY_DN2152_c0_g1_i2:553-2064(-)
MSAAVAGSSKKSGGTDASKLSKRKARVNTAMSTTFTSGRPPWYDEKGGLKEPLIIGVAGGSGGGKTTVCEAIVSACMIDWVSLVHMDNFYKPLTPEQSALANQNLYNFDHPDAFDIELLNQVLADLKAGKSVNIPIYDFVTHNRVPNKFVKVYGADVIILEGIFVLYEKKILDQLDVKLFVDTEDDIRLARRLRRDILERGRDVRGVIQQYDTYVKKAFDDFIHPSKQFADIIIPRGANNVVAISLIANHIKKKLVERGWKMQNKARSKKLPKHVSVVAQTDQLKYITTILRDKNTNRDDFIFYADRVSRLVVESALNLLPADAVTVTTPTEAKYTGLSFDTTVCGVSIMRSGDAMTHPLTEVVKEAPMGTVLIQFDEKRVPRLFFYRLPELITEDCYVLLMDPVIETGSTLHMAVRLLLDHGVREERIIVCSILSNKVGLSHVCYAYPRLRIVTSMVDQKLDTTGANVPGIGHFGDRYFGTEQYDQGSDSEFSPPYSPDLNR